LVWACIPVKNTTCEIEAGLALKIIWNLTNWTHARVTRLENSCMFLYIGDTRGSFGTESCWSSDVVNMKPIPQGCVFVGMCIDPCSKFPDSSVRCMFMQHSCFKHSRACLGSWIMLHLGLKVKLSCRAKMKSLWQILSWMSYWV
jgi:hypothetical protein